MEDHLRVYATQAGLNPFEERLREPKIHTCLEKNNEIISCAFQAYAIGETMTMESFVAFTSDAETFAEGKRFSSIEDVKVIVGDNNTSGHGHHGHRHSANSMIVQSASKIGDGALLFEEFAEAIVRMANVVCSEQKPLGDKTNRLCTNVISPLLTALNEEDEKKNEEKEPTEGKEKVAEEEKKEESEEKKEGGAADTEGAAAAVAEGEEGGEEKKEEEAVDEVKEEPKIHLKGKTLKKGPKARPPRRF